MSIRPPKRTFFFVYSILTIYGIRIPLFDFCAAFFYKLINFIDIF
nr:MAG TPA: hypothetical protein [Caudoviricetes sp.]